MLKAFSEREKEREREPSESVHWEYKSTSFNSGDVVILKLTATAYSCIWKKIFKRCIANFLASSLRVIIGQQVAPPNKVLYGVFFLTSLVTFPTKPIKVLVLQFFETFLSIHHHSLLESRSEFVCDKLH